MPNSLPALFIGRFQPLHLGHLDAVVQIGRREKFLIIGIGSTEDDFVPENPFTAGERYQMIEAVMESKESPWPRSQKYAIIPVRNINHYALWVSHLESLLPPFGTVYTGSKIVERLFAQTGRHMVRRIIVNKDISATQVREKMLLGKAWQDDVPKQVCRLINKWHGVERLRDIQQ